MPASIVARSVSLLSRRVSIELNRRLSRCTSTAPSWGRGAGLSSRPTRPRARSSLCRGLCTSSSRKSPPATTLPLSRESEASRGSGGHQLSLGKGANNHTFSSGLSNSTQTPSLGCLVGTTSGQWCSRLHSSKRSSWARSWGRFLPEPGAGSLVLSRRPLSWATSEGGKRSKATSLRRMPLARSRPICSIWARSSRWPSSNCSTPRLAPQLSNRNRASRSSRAPEGRLIGYLLRGVPSGTNT